MHHVSHTFSLKHASKGVAFTSYKHLKPSTLAGHTFSLKRTNIFAFHTCSLKKKVFGQIYLPVLPL